jgi:predicted unusual protein kinase regulating ubiquinone biosynthesis (AarF/ABC1/UbiB family)
MTMPPNVADLLEALPIEEADPQSGADESVLRELAEKLATRPIPIGSVRRLTSLGNLQFKIGLAYAMHWLRGWFQSAEQSERDLAETHFRTAIVLLHSMCYLRGAVMKLGQTLANFPDIVPEQFVETLESLHFEAPPMHFSLLREMVHNELGGDPSDVFESFDEQAFAAASLGQVHRARLKTGEQVVVKIQYPGIARSVRSDFRNLTPFLFPARLSADWNSAKAMFDEIRRAVERETDYEQEARTQEEARALFNEDDGIIVPRIHRELSTRRVLTMDYVDGVHCSEFKARNPSQELCNHFGEKMIQAWYRLLFSGRMEYADWHPGNFLFQEDGRLGLIDFGFVHRFDDREWEFVRRADRLMQTKDPSELDSHIRDWCEITGDTTADRERLRLCVEWAERDWKPRLQDGPFDFGDLEELRSLVDTSIQLTRNRHTCGQSSTAILTRNDLGYRGMLYRLGAKIDFSPIRDREVLVTGWEHTRHLQP